MSDKKCPFCNTPMDYLGESVDPDTGDNSVDVFDTYFCDNCTHEMDFFVTKLYET